MVNLMFIRFVCGEIDEDSHVSAGLFCAAFDLIKQEKFSEQPDTSFMKTQLRYWHNRPQMCGGCFKEVNVQWRTRLYSSR